MKKLNLLLLVAITIFAGSAFLAMPKSAHANIVGPQSCPDGYHLAVRYVRGPRYVAAIYTCVINR